VIAAGEGPLSKGQEELGPPHSTQGIALRRSKFICL